MNEDEMPKREEESLKRTYRFAKSLLTRLEEEAAKNRRAVNTQLEIILEEWFAQEDKKAQEKSSNEDQKEIALTTE
jgi:hypothetical protein